MVYTVASARQNLRATVEVILWSVRGPEGWKPTVGMTQEPKGSLALAGADAAMIKGDLHPRAR
jgi:hypothetical protein